MRACPCSLLIHKLLWLKREVKNICCIAHAYVLQYEPMGKRKKIIKVFIVLVLAGGVFAGSFFGYKALTKKDASKEDTSAQQEVARKEAEAGQQRINSFNDILLAYAEKKYDVVITQAQSFGQSSANGVTEKVNAYVLCIQAAIELKQDTAKQKCYDDAKKLLETSSPDEAFKKDWLASIEDAYKGTNSSTVKDDGPS